MKLVVSPAGRVTKVSFGSMTGKDPAGEVPEAFLKAVLKIYRGLEFPRIRRPVPGRRAADF